MKRLLLLSLLSVALVRAAGLSVTLEEARDIALRNHPNLASAQLAASVAEEQVKEARAGFFPVATGFVNGVEAGDRDTRIEAGGLNNPAIYDRVAEGVSVTAVITDFGRTGNLTSGAKSRARAEHAGYESTREQVLLGVDTTYYGVLQAKAVMKVAQDTLGVRTLLASQVSTLAKNAMKSDLDVSFAEVAKNEAELLLEKAQGDEASAEAMLSAAMGYPTPQEFDLPEPDSTPITVPALADLSASALRTRPDLLRYRYERDASRSAAQAEKDANYPTLSAVGVAGTSPSHDYRLPNSYEAGGLQLSIPLFAGGAYVARQHEAELKAHIAEEQLRQEEDLVTRDVKLAWIAASTSIRRLEISRQLLTNSSRAFELAQARYKVGSSSIIELSDAQLAETTAKIEVANAEYAALIQESVLRYVAGIAG